MKRALIATSLGLLLAAGAGCGDTKDKGATIPTETIPIIEGGPTGAGVKPGPQGKDPGKANKKAPPSSVTVD